MFTLPKNSRHFFKEPFGELFPDIAEVLPRLSCRLVCTVGDVVTHNLLKHRITPAIAVIDGHTMRSPCGKDPQIIGRHIRVNNPAGSLTDELIAGIRDAVRNPPATVDVAGEEDLAVIPLVIAAPLGSVILYGQPGRGVVLCIVDETAKEKAGTLLSHFVRS